MARDADPAQENALMEAWLQMRPFRRLLNGLRKGEGSQRVHGLTDDAASFFFGAVALAMGRPALVLVPTEEDAARLVLGVRSWYAQLATSHFPALEGLPFEAIPGEPGRMARRQAARALLMEAAPAGAAPAPCVVVASARAAARRLAPAEALRAASVAVQVGDEVAPGRLERILVQGGYHRVDRVDAPGEFARRGGILDVYPVASVSGRRESGEPGPVRLDFFGDLLESIRRFDPAEQRSLESLERVRLAPVTESPLAPGELAGAAGRLRAAVDAYADRAADRRETRAAARLRNRLAPLLERMEQGDASGLENQLPFLYSRLSHLCAALPAQGLIMVWRPGRVREQCKRFAARARERLADGILEGRLLPDHHALYLEPAELEGELRDRLLVEASSLPDRRAGGPTPIELRSRPAPAFGGDWSRFAARCGDWRGQGYRVLIAAPGSGAAGQIAAHLERMELAVQRAGSFWGRGAARAILPGEIVVAPGQLDEGFVLPGAGLIALPAERLTGRRRRRHAAPLYADEGERVRQPGDLALGDYVVHIHHGIGRYRGVRTLEVQGTRRDYLFLEYAGEDRLYVPVDQLDLVQKYRGGDGTRPKIYALGTKDWDRVKQRVKASVRELAEGLLQLYAAREALQGYAFSPDSEWQRDFEAAFPYDETPGQRAAIQEVKEDLEKARPMDRLLCGDVGYGKTEVAMRGAFKAVMDGKQVAVLVPTTVLAQQHYLTFSDRFDDFPVEVDVLSRFQTRREQARTLDAVRRGKVDVLIGTHRLLQDDVAFKDLGLLVVDEEHRFGVAHKERLKQLRQNVDVVTLTATPIPRTLHMALAGLRDMSTIDTPPPGRYPIETHVAQYENELIRDAIRRELERGGQVFYVHNRVRSIDFARRRLARLVPDARVAVAHGQMNEDQLETVMLDFVAREADVLLCTTIIESGLDIANANTLIVEDADRLGLAQLYQLRGRVGRSSRLAYAYFTYRHRRALSEEAEQRLEAIREFTELGSGYQIAMRDLEIRGAGNLLGPEQHGFIASVGFELYCQLLESAVTELKGDARRPAVKPVLELVIDAFIPDAYVSSPAQKLECYKRINRIDSPEAADDVRDLLMDRFGEPPEPVERLIELERVRVAAGRTGILSISSRGPQSLVLQFAGMTDAVFQRAVRLVKEAGDLRFEPGETPVMVLDVRDRKPPARLERLSAVITALLAGAKQTSAGPSQAESSLRIK